ncbi:hypothetical protein SCUP515_13363 [Seiridium cupressi]
MRPIWMVSTLVPSPATSPTSSTPWAETTTRSLSTGLSTSWHSARRTAPRSSVERLVVM